jgi:hypothetical protein
MADSGETKPSASINEFKFDDASRVEMAVQLKK